MTKRMKFQARRIIAIAILYLVLGVVIGKAIGIGIDNNAKQQEMIMMEHNKIHKIK